jgi:hypothetical protein
VLVRFESLRALLSLGVVRYGGGFASRCVQVIKGFLSNEEFTFDRVNNASKACGPLCSWVTSQVHYSAILERVQPLREEVAKLEQQGAELQEKQRQSDAVIHTLEASIERYKQVRQLGLRRLLLRSFP